MVFADSGACRERRGNAATAPPMALKVLVAGGPGAGKTTLVGSASEVGPLRAEDFLGGARLPYGRPGRMREAAEAEEADAHRATVAMDFGRITLSGRLTLCLLAAPGQECFRPLWEELVPGALGAVLLADIRRPRDCLGALDRLQRHAVPYAVAVNYSDGAGRPPKGAVRAALGLDATVPVLPCDVRDRGSVREVLASVVEHAMTAGAP
ncbi:ATP/GTP-binding protein [Streptomyces sp. CNQ085]|uniref:GTP-binding protein n=1 Tax=Streptomyces sp. CNQ085 TaxID=2886944 RepID=UPI001F51557D|nr:ATP/GTP-binding protein [Streptomyces sp. CNQ085]MCI0385708.1 ATP/GTP-binding protein [Streptomyces sp. CNQ085]